MTENSKISKVKKNPDGNITDIMLQNGTVYSVEDAIPMVKEGLILGVNVGRAKNGREYLRADPNTKLDDNLDNLPTFN